jgi:hypothetical protein
MAIVTNNNKSEHLEHRVEELKDKVISEYLKDTMNDVSGTAAIASINESARGNPRMNQLKNLLDKARSIYWNLRSADLRHMSEEFWEDQMMLLVGMCPTIDFTNQYAVVDNTNNSGPSGVRFFDFVEIKSETVRVFELKARTITEQDVLSTIESGTIYDKDKGRNIICKGYPQVIKDNWPDKKTKLIFTSPYGIEAKALNRIQSEEGVFYIHYKDLARRIFTEILESYPEQADWKYESIKDDKYRHIF